MARIKVKPGVPLKMDKGDNISYDLWMHRVDMLLLKYFGITSADLPDCDTYQWWSERLRPIRAANRILRNAGKF